MKVSEAIKALKKLPPDAELKAIDADSGDEESVTGFLYDHNVVLLQTDEI